MKTPTRWMSSRYPENLIENAERLSGFLGISRSELLREALDEYLTRRLSSLSSSEVGSKEPSVEAMRNNYF